MHFAYLAEACVLVSRFSQLNISHFHAHFGTNSAMVVLLNHVLGGPAYSFTVHGPKEFEKVEAIGLPKKLTVPVLFWELVPMVEVNFIAGVTIMNGTKLR